MPSSEIITSESQTQINNNQIAFEKMEGMIKKVIKEMLNQSMKTITQREMVNTKRQNAMIEALDDRFGKCIDAMDNRMT